MTKPGRGDAERIGDRLERAGLVTRADLELGAKAAHAGNDRIGEALVRAGQVSEPDLYQHLAAQAGLPFADLQRVLADADSALFQKVPPRFLTRHHLLPVKIDGDELVVVTTEPLLDASELGWALGARAVRRLLVTPTDLQRMRAALELGQVGATRLTSVVSGKDVLSTEMEVDATLVALLNAILGEAVSERASDIHLERYGSHVRVRMRIDGDLVDMTHYRLTPEQHLGLVNVVKLRGGLDIAERRMPQGGRSSVRAGEATYDLRIQTQPSLHGEHVVIRLLAQKQRVIEIESLGFPPHLSKAYRRLLESPGGLVLVVGPTGSGKSTTLYAGLQVLAKDATRKVLTIEDPIEYAIDDVQQTQVRPELGFNFADAMRVFVRQDPDVILIGEIRDAETALEAMRASQTGHLVLSTLHCNDAVDAVQRLVDLGVHPNSIASELVAVFAQRLARRICDQCRVPAVPDPAHCAEVFPHGVPADFRCFRGAGCPHCKGRGSYDRIAVVEFLPASAPLRLAIARRQPLDELRATARRVGVQSMRTHALTFVRDGVIAFEELRTLLSFEQMNEGPTG